MNSTNITKWGLLAFEFIQVPLLLKKITGENNKKQFCEQKWADCWLTVMWKVTLSSS